VNTALGNADKRAMVLDLLVPEQPGKQGE